MDAVALEQHRIRLCIRQIIDRHEFEAAIVSFENGPGDEAPDTPEPVDRNFHSHVSSLAVRR